MKLLITILVIFAALMYVRHRASVFLGESVLQLKQERNKTDWVAGNAECIFFLGFVVIQHFLRRPVSATDPTLIALAVMSLCASLGFCGLNLWGEFKYLSERKPDALNPLAVFCGCGLGMKLCWAGLTYAWLLMIWQE